MSAVERAAEVIAREYGPCHDSVNHTEREPRFAAEALAEAGLLATDADLRNRDLMLRLSEQLTPDALNASAERHRLDRAVLDAADDLSRWWDALPSDVPLADAPARLSAAARARREAQA